MMTNYKRSLVLFRHVLNKRLSNSFVNSGIKRMFDFYEDFTGIKEVRKTQESVLKVESEFVESSKARRAVQNDMIALQDQLKQVRQKLDSTHRSEEAYLPLITKEHQLIKNEIQMLNSLRTLEETERDLFSTFSQKLRDAHEVERLRQEKTKYLSVIGSIIGACLGIIATSINHAMKRKDYQELIKLLETRVTLSPTANQSFNIPLNSDNNNGISQHFTSNSTQTIETNDNKIVEYISLTESNLEYKMKINALTTVAATYALIAITLPFIVRLFND